MRFMVVGVHRLFVEIELYDADHGCIVLEQGQDLLPGVLLQETNEPELVERVLLLQNYNANVHHFLHRLGQLNNDTSAHKDSEIT